MRTVHEIVVDDGTLMLTDESGDVIAILARTVAGEEIYPGPGHTGFRHDHVALMHQWAMDRWSGRRDSYGYWVREARRRALDPLRGIDLIRTWGLLHPDQIEARLDEAGREYEATALVTLPLFVRPTGTRCLVPTAYDRLRRIEHSLISIQGYMS